MFTLYSRKENSANPVRRPHLLVIEVIFFGPHPCGATWLSRHSAQAQEVFSHHHFGQLSVTGDGAPRPCWHLLTSEARDFQPPAHLLFRRFVHESNLQVWQPAPSILPECKAKKLAGFLPVLATTILNARRLLGTSIATSRPEAVRRVIRGAPRGRLWSVSRSPTITSNAPTGALPAPVPPVPRTPRSRAPPGDSDGC